MRYLPQPLRTTGGTDRPGAATRPAASTSRRRGTSRSTACTMVRAYTELAEGKCGGPARCSRTVRWYSRIHTYITGVPDRKGDVAERRQDRRLDLFGHSRSNRQQGRQGAAQRPHTDGCRSPSAPRRDSRTNAWGCSTSSDSTSGACAAAQCAGLCPRARAVGAV
jgi:hypothetical protein